MLVKKQLSQLKNISSASGALICLKADGTFGGAKLNYESF